MTNTTKILIAGGLVVLLAIAGVFAYTSMMNNDSMDNNSSNQSMSQDEVMVGGAAMLASRNIIENVSNANNLTTLVSAVQAADLVETLSGPGPFTVFGPDNAAFEKLPEGTLETVLKPENKTMLQDILKYHVVSGNYRTEDLTDGQTLTTVLGQTLTVQKTGDSVMVGNATIVTPDVPQSNGVAHVIDTVLLPETNPTVGGAAMYRSLNLVENVSTAPNLTTLVAAVKAADLVETLSGPGPFTAFGPDNAAFEKLPAGTVEELVKPENKDRLTSILTYHVVSGNYQTSDLVDGQTLTTVNGQQLTVMKQDGKVMLKGGSDTNIATIVTADVIQSNGVAHVIDTVLLPASN